MSRETERRKSTRATAPLNDSNPVRIDEQRRFFSSQGNDSAVREARALQEAFGTATEFAGNQLDRNNVAGSERALETAGAGGSRDADDSNAAYHRTWDLLDDERNLQFAKKALPEALRQANGEQMTEEQRQDFTNKWLASQFKGLDTENGDHSWFGKGLVELETDVLLTYRDADTAATKELQRTDLFSAEVENYRDQADDYETLINAGVTDAPMPTVRYDLLAERTDAFFENEEKMLVFWESVYDLAKELGDVSVIDNVPERFALSGDPTGINDPFRQKEHDAARAAALAVAKQRADTEAEALSNASKARTEATKLRIYHAQADGYDISHMVDEAVINGFIPVSEALTFDSGLGGQLVRRMDTSEQSSTMAQLNYRIIAEPSEVSYEVIKRAYDLGVFGEPDSSQARAKYRTTLNDLESAKSAAASRNSGDTPFLKARRDEIKDVMAPKRDEWGEPRSNLEVNLRAEMLRRYDEKAESGSVDPATLQKELLDEYQTRVQSIRSHYETFAENATAAAVNFSNNGMNEQQFTSYYKQEGWTLTDLDALEQSDPVAYKKAVAAIYNQRNRK